MEVGVGVEFCLRNHATRQENGRGDGGQRLSLASKRGKVNLPITTSIFLVTEPRFQ